MSVSLSLMVSLESPRSESRERLSVACPAHGDKPGRDCAGVGAAPALRQSSTCAVLLGAKAGMIACVGIIHKENNPLLIKAFPPQLSQGSGGPVEWQANAQPGPIADGDDTKFHHICYCAIDVFEEREQAMRASAGGGARQMDTVSTVPSHTLRVRALRSSCRALIRDTKATRIRRLDPRVRGPDHFA